MVQSSLTAPSAIPGVRDRLKARNGTNSDPIAAIKSYEDLPAVLTAPKTSPPITRVDSTPAPQLAPIADEDDDADASGLYDGLDLAFDPAKLTWLTPSRGSVTTDAYLSLSPDLNAVRISRGVRTQLGEAAHVQIAFAADDLMVLRITRTVKSNKFAVKVRSNGTIGMKWLATEMTVRGWKHGRYTVHRAAPDYLTIRLKDRIGDCPTPPSRPATKKAV